MSGSRTPAATPGPAWRQFNFFDLSEVKDAQDLAQSPAAFRSLVPPYILIAPSPTSPLYATVSCIISDSKGYISVLDKKFQVEKKWKGWAGDDDETHVGGKGKGKGKEKEKGVMLLECGGVLLGIGEDESSSQFPMLKIWDLMHDDKKTRNPVLMRNVRIGVGNRAFPVSSMTTTSNLSYLAIGLVSGQVLLYRHLATSLTTSPLALTSFPKARVVWEGSIAEPITGLGFREASSVRHTHPSHAAETSSSSPIVANKTTHDKDVTTLFFTTPNKVICAASVTGRGTEPRILDEQAGAGLGCVAMTSDKRDLVVGREDGIYLFGLEGKGSCIAYEGPKASIHTNTQTVIIVSPPFTPTAASASSTIRRAAASATINGLGTPLNESAKLTIFDLENKFVAYSGVFKDGIRETFSSSDQVFVVGGDGKLSRLQEQPTSVKLEALFKKSFYQLAISLARSSGVDDAGIADIYAKYGDHLYVKGDFDGSVAQYVKTLGYLQPSYVIRKFLDAQRIHNLTTYLQELHSQGLANPDHTTLLLNCYTKTADKSRLDKFLKTETLRSDTGHNGELPFDLDTAIRVCRQAGFYEHAVYLARKYNKHEDYLSIQIEDARDFADSLNYLRSLGPAVAEQNLLKYGRMMLQAQPEETTDLLIDLCSGHLLRKREEAKEAAALEAAVKTKVGHQAGGPGYLSFIGYDKVTEVLGIGTEDKPNGIKGTAAESTPETDVAPDATANGDAPTVKPTVDTRYDPPSPRQYFAHFVDHRTQFIRFLETVASDRWNQRIDMQAKRTKSHLQQIPLPMDVPMEHQDDEVVEQRAVWNTLLELYLTGPEEPDEGDSRAIRLLEQADVLPVDPMHALMLCSTSDFTPGLIGLWERLGMYEDILRFWMERDETEDKQTGSQKKPASQNVIHHLGVYGPTNLHLYPLVLRYLTSSSALLSRHTEDLKHILQVIDEERIMPPLAVVQLLSRNDVASIGVVKDWLKRKVAETKQDVESDKKLVDSYRSETQEKERDMTSLTDTLHPQVFQVTRCASCGGQLDLPSVHFMCKHSYHQRCLPDTDPECPACARQYAVIREIRRNQQELADRHDLFLSEVEDAEDGFAVIAGAFGRNLFVSSAGAA